MFAEFAARTLDGKRKKEVFLCKNKLIIKQRVSGAKKESRKDHNQNIMKVKKGI
jgi:hypothetical protein